MSLPSWPTRSRLVPGAGIGAGAGDLPVANSAWTEGAKRILYLRVRFADQDPDYEPVSLATAQSHQTDVEEHFRVASYGKMTVTTVFPDMITLPEDKSAYVGQGLGLMMNDARALAITMGQAQGVDWDYNNFDFYTIVSDSGIGGYAGIAQVGGRKSHLQKNYTSLRTSGHEFGHNFGLLPRPLQLHQRPQPARVDAGRRARCGRIWAPLQPDECPERKRSQPTADAPLYRP